MIHAGPERQDDRRIISAALKFRSQIASRGALARRQNTDHASGLIRIFHLTSELYILGRCKVDMTMDD